MAISSGTINAVDIALRAADKPILFGRNWIRTDLNVSTTAWWNQVGDFNDGDGNEEAATGPTTRAFDEFDHLQTFPDANNATWYLMFDLGTNFGFAANDALIILNHNLNTAGADVVFIQLSEADDFSSPLTLEVQTPSSDKRLVFMNFDKDANAPISAFADGGGGQVVVSSTLALSENDTITIQGTTNYNDTYTATSVNTGVSFEITEAWNGDDATGWAHNDTTGAPRRYANARYMRIGLTGLASVPKIGETIWSFSRQLKHKPEGQWDKSNLRSSISRFESSTGIITDHVFHKGRRRVSMQLSPHEDEYIDDLIAFFETEIAYGTWPFILIDDPGTAPTDANWMKYETPEQISPLIGYTQRSFPIIALEQGPNFLALGV